MRAYFLTNMYLSSIQNGIQPAHCLGNMFVKYRNTAINEMNPQDKRDSLYDWAENHKTMIVLNGGYSSVIRDLCLFLSDDQNPYPWDYFCESEEALDKALTCAGIVLPERIYEKIKDVSNYNELVFNEILFDEGFTPWESELIFRLSAFGLAR